MPITLKALKFTAILVCLLGSLVSATAAPIDTRARNAILIDVASGAILLSKDADTPIPPASMSKLMTVEMVFEALASGRLSMEEQFVVSEKAWRMGGSKMFVRINDRISVKDLLYGVIVQSGNDACIVLAEGLAGSEEEFARRMTQTARRMGLSTASFTNATGWPDPDHLISVHDLARLAQNLIERFPQYYGIFAEEKFTWENITQSNRNPLLQLDIGADGLKTGHTEEAGYGLVGSAVQDGRRLILAITGLDSAAARAQEAERILRWGFRDFETRKIFNAGQKIGEATVWVGEDDSVPLVTQKDVIITAPFGKLNKISAEIIYDGPLEAPITEGDAVAKLRLNAPDISEQIVTLHAGKTVNKGGVTAKLKDVSLLLLDRFVDVVFPETP